MVIKVELEVVPEEKFVRSSAGCELSKCAIIMVDRLFAAGKPSVKAIPKLIYLSSFSQQVEICNPNDDAFLRGSP